MRTLLLVPALGLVAALIGSPPAASQDRDWVDLLGRNMKDWTRIGEGKNSWHLSSDRILSCGAGTQDGYAPDLDMRDGTLKFDYRFKDTGKKTGYKASVTARWTKTNPGCQVELGDNCGTINTAFVAASDAYKEMTITPAVKPNRAPGEWNQVKLVMKDTTVLVVINGKDVGSFERCITKHGSVLFSAERSEVEFRNILWRAEK